ncbi:MAG: FAD-binding oxidoreductase [Sediminimonas qiaohouensis]|uniref:FAD-binding oxidoreductase n=1 Tax=Sediminimonas qiaohouensis TaxID=552061 RepID=A0A7C9L649_9RHOB|nr:FAD-binding oxidoreductase [Sediminimonas qiaohouensis]MTJ03493.1 FAD-binding oxidoreductase [Sediminimonas qiaohouensis]
MTLNDFTRDVLSKQALAERLDGFKGMLLAPGEAGFDDAAAIWNGTVKARPGLIAQCTGAGDVATVVRAVAHDDIRLSVKGGGHNVAGTAVCDGGLMLDLSPMNDVAVDPDGAIVRAGGGATWGAVDAAAQAHGLATPGGLVSKTGIGGLTLGGGYGWLRRKHGLSCDALISAEIVTADGEIRTASAEQNADLFWAIRGGGGNFGVVTRFDYRLFPLGPEVFFSFVVYPLEEGRQVLRGWRDFCANAADEVTSLALCGTVPEDEAFEQRTHGRHFAALATMYAGPPGEGERALSPLRQLGTPLADFSGPAPYIEVQQHFDEDYPDGMRYYWTSLYLPDCPDGAIDTLLELSRERPSALTTVEFWQLGGAMARVDADATAFGARDAAWMLAVESNWEDPAADARNTAWTREARARMAAYSTGEGYRNFDPEPGHGPEAGGAQIQRLREVKRRYDPANLFRHNHNITPAQG